MKCENEEVTITPHTMSTQHLDNISVPERSPDEIIEDKRISLTTF